MMEIHEIAKELKLPYIKSNYQLLLDEAAHTKMNHKELLQTFLENEYELRLENGLRNRLRKAKFPTKKYLTDFDRSKYDKKFHSKFDELETLEFIEKKESIYTDVYGKNQILKILLKEKRK
jgi:DNA replication protein DnaC